MDTIVLSDLELWTRIGVTEDERASEQRVLVSVEMAIDARKAAARDDHRLSIDYAEVARDIRALGATDRRTIERLAEDVAATILRKHRPTWTAVAVRKFALPGLRAASVHIVRERWTTKR